MEVIISKIIGGVGNQFFQYAVARALSLRTGMALKLDIEDFEEYNLRKFELENFNINVEIATPEEIKKLKKKKIFNKTYFKEKKAEFNSKINKIKKSAYLEGYWQNEKYFKDFEKEIKNDFIFKKLDFIKNQDILEEILCTNSVSINIRLGDYLSEQNREIYHICKNKYYENAMKYISEKIKNPVFYLFSDDHEYVEENYEFCAPVKIIKSGSWQEDFYLMQKCKHNIIPNSSFAWLAAWLNKNSEKIVVAPKFWYNPNSKVKNDDIVPKNWIKADIE